MRRATADGPWAEFTDWRRLDHATPGQSCALAPPWEGSGAEDGSEAAVWRYVHGIAAAHPGPG